VWDSGQGNGKGGASGFLQSMAGTLPPMMHVLRDIAGVELPGYMGRLAEPPEVAEVEPGALEAPAKE